MFTELFRAPVGFQRLDYMARMELCEELLPIALQLPSDFYMGQN